MSRVPAEGWASRNRYALLAGGLVLMAVGYELKLRWPAGIDIWEHAAAARELGLRPFDPSHPLLPVDRPHQFFSPYLMVVGVLGRLAGVSVITALDVAAVFNLVLLLVGLRLFVRRMTARPHAAFYALLFVLFLWGPGAWFFSGFLHFDVVFLVLSYPSTFAKGLVLIALAAHSRYLQHGRSRRLVPLLLLGAVVLLTHPVDAVFLAVGAVALAVTDPAPGKARTLAVTLLAVAGWFLLALAWPPLPFFELLFGDGAEGYRTAIALADGDMYDKVLERLGLALLVVPFAIRRLWHWRRDPLVVMLAGTLVGYGYGWVSGEWSFGRLISSAQLVGAVLLADERAELGRRLVGRPRRVVQWTTAAVVLAGVVILRNGFVALPDVVVGGPRYRLLESYVNEVRIADFDFLADHHQTYPVVVSDVYTSLEIPAFGPKVIAPARAQAFVDTTERGSDLARFYDPRTTAEVRRLIIAKYGASLLVVRVDHLAEEPTRYGPLLELGRVVARNDEFVYVDLRPASA